MDLLSSEIPAGAPRFRSIQGKANSANSNESAFPGFCMRGSPRKSKAPKRRFRKSIPTKLRRRHARKQQRQKGSRVLFGWLSFGLWGFGVDWREPYIAEPRGSAELIFKGQAQQSPSLNQHEICISGFSQKVDSLKKWIFVGRQNLTNENADVLT